MFSHNIIIKQKYILGNGGLIWLANEYNIIIVNHDLNHRVSFNNFNYF